MSLKAKHPKIKTELDKVSGTSDSMIATIYNWVNEFKCDRTSTK